MARVLDGPVPQPPALRHGWTRLLDPDQDPVLTDDFDELTADEGIVLLDSQFLDSEP